MYESDITKFIRNLLEQHPELETLQKRNRATWWDRQPEPDGAKDTIRSQEPVKGYYYFPLPEPEKPSPKQ
jgi:Protein of unknown function (DUF3460)